LARMVKPGEKKREDDSSSDDSYPQEQRTKANVWEKIAKFPTKGTPGAYKYVKKIINEPERAKLWVEFAVYLLSMRDFARAERYFKRSIFVDPNYASAFACYGLFLGKLIFLEKKKKISLPNILL